ncbi:MAG: OadG family protein [Clostridiales bacterium]|nr:OadG family protein [Clostridiales bacterium]
MDWGYTISITIIGTLVVFSALILLVLFVQSMGLISTKSSNRDKKDKDAPTDKGPANITKEQKPTTTQNISPVVNDDIDSEIVAVITAAISQMRLKEGNTAGFKVKNIARASNPRPIWGLAGIQENTRAF